MSSTTKIGFIGIGNMGWPMAASLVNAGHELVVYDNDVTKVKRFADEHGVLGAASLFELSDREVLITMLPTGIIVKQVLLESGLSEKLKSGAIVVDMSSSEPVGSRNIASALRKRNIFFMDAPVSGGVPRAIAGTLAIMYGTDDPQVADRVTSILGAMGDRLFATGGVGTGHAMKALNNFVAAAAYTATAEAMLIGERFGLDQETMIDILNVSTGRNFFTDLVMKEHVIGRKFATGFTVGLLAKDVSIAAGLSDAMGQYAPSLDLIKKRWIYARDTIGADKDNSEAIMAWKIPQPE